MQISPEMIPTIATYVVLFLALYLLFIRPQRKEQKKRAALLDGLKKNDKVITIGGLYGTIVALNDKTVTLKVAEKVELDFSRSAIASYQNENKETGK